MGVDICQVINFMLEYNIGEINEEDGSWFHYTPYIWCNN